MYNAIFSGFPGGKNFPFSTPADAVVEGIDTNTGAEWVSLPFSGWQPNVGPFAKATVNNTTAAQASLLVFTAPVTGVYQLATLATQATSTNGTLPNFTVTYTDANLGSSVTQTVTGAATTGAGQSQTGTVSFKAKANTTVTIAAAAPTTLTANEDVRVSFLG